MLTNSAGTRMFPGLPVDREGVQSGDCSGLQNRNQSARSSAVAGAERAATPVTARVAGPHDGSRSPDGKGSVGDLLGSSRVATDEEVEHAQLLAVLDRIHRRNEAARVRTRLPAGLSEDELARGYAPCAGGA